MLLYLSYGFSRYRNRLLQNITVNSMLAYGTNKYRYNIGSIKMISYRHVSKGCRDDTGLQSTHTRNVTCISFPCVFSKFASFSRKIIIFCW